MAWRCQAQFVLDKQRLTGALEAGHFSGENLAMGTNQTTRRTGDGRSVLATDQATESRNLGELSWATWVCPLSEPWELLSAHGIGQQIWRGYAQSLGLDAIGSGA